MQVASVHFIPTADEILFGDQRFAARLDHIRRSTEAVSEAGSAVVLVEFASGDSKPGVDDLDYQEVRGTEIRRARLLRVRGWISDSRWPQVGVSMVETFNSVCREYCIRNHIEGTLGGVPYTRKELAWINENGNSPVNRELLDNWVSRRSSVAADEWS